MEVHFSCGVSPEKGFHLHEHFMFPTSDIVFQVGDRDDSNVYIKQKLNGAAECGINAKHLKLPNTTTQHEVCNFQRSIIEDPKIIIHSLQL